MFQFLQVYRAFVVGALWLSFATTCSSTASRATAMLQFKSQMGVKGTSFSLRRALQEPGGNAAKSMMTLDTNHNGRVEPQEINAFALAQGLDAQSVSAEFSTMDTDGDGSLDARELAGAIGDAPVSRPSAMPAAQTAQRTPALASMDESSKTNAAAAANQAAAIKAVAARPATLPIRVQTTPPDQTARASSSVVAVPSDASAASTVALQQRVAPQRGGNVQEKVVAHVDAKSAVALVVQDLAEQEKLEADADALETKAAELRANLTAFASETKEKADRAAATAAKKTATEIAQKWEELERKAQRAEADAAGLRAKSHAELLEAESMMEITKGTVPSQH